MRAWPMALVLLAACGQGPAQVSPDGAGSNGSGSADAAVGSDGGTQDSWQMLVSRSWSLPPPQDHSISEAYRCTRIQVPTDTWIGGFRLLDPAGTEQALVTIDPDSTHTGDYDECSAASGVVNEQLIYAGGVGTDDVVFPPGIGVHLAAGTWINLNLHVYNDSAASRSGTSGVLVKLVPQGSVMHEVDMLFSGTRDQIDIPSDGQPHIAVGGCVASGDWNVVGVWPHMHRSGTHQQLYVFHPGATSKVLDHDYHFLDQEAYAKTDAVHAGDQIQTVCTYVNTTGVPLTYAETLAGEMCFTGIYKYPAGGTMPYDCTN